MEVLPLLCIKNFLSRLFSGKNNRDRQKDCKSGTEGYNMSWQSHCKEYSNSLGTISVNVI